MAQDHYISRYIQVSAQGIFLNGELVSGPSDAVGMDFLIAAFKGSGIVYPKFYKMDNLCKLSILAVELLLRDTGFAGRYAAEDMAVVVSCANASLDTDTRYWDTVPAAPSPSLFVYTLPNVMIGELCIRWGIRGENTCFVSDQFDASFQTDYVNGLFDNGDAQVRISGWSDYLDGKMEAFFMLVEKNPTSLDRHNPQTVQKLYDRQWKN